MAVGNKAPWEKYLAEDLIYTDENWQILTKKDLVDGLQPLPKGYTSTIRMANVQSRVNGDAAVLSFRVLLRSILLILSTSFCETFAPATLVCVKLRADRSN